MNLSADLISSVHNWYVACGLLPDDSGEYRVKRTDVPQPQGVCHDKQIPHKQDRESYASNRKKSTKRR